METAGLMVFEKIMRPGCCQHCGASCLLAPLRPREARVNNSRHTRGIYFSKTISLSHSTRAVAVPALPCRRKYGQENMGRENINQSRRRRISGRTSMRAITARCDRMKTQGLLILYVCLCVFPTAYTLAQSHRADSKGLYLQRVRTIHS